MIALMVDHVVSIDHTFSVPSGAGIVVHVDQERDEIEIQCQFARGTAWIRLTREELMKVAEIFQALPAEGTTVELMELFTVAAAAVGL
jgi:hypothetical protein